MGSLSLAKDSNLPGCGWMTGHPHLTGRLPINRSGGVSRRVIDELPTIHPEPEFRAPNLPTRMSCDDEPGYTLVRDGYKTLGVS